MRHGAKQSLFPGSLWSSAAVVLVDFVIALMTRPDTALVRAGLTTAALIIGLLFSPYRSFVQLLARTSIFQMAIFFGPAFLFVALMVPATTVERILNGITIGACILMSLAISDRLFHRHRD